MFGLFQEDKWDVPRQNYLFVRERAMNIPKIPMGTLYSNRIMYNRVYIFWWPISSVNNSTGSHISVEVEKHFYNFCYNILAEDSIKIPPEESLDEWNESHSLTKNTFSEKGSLKNLDEAFLDKSVANILFIYYIPQNINKRDVYKYLVENKITNIYKRKKSDGLLSKFVVNTFGFPCDSKFNNF